MRRPREGQGTPSDEERAAMRTIVQTFPSSRTTGVSGPRTRWSAAVFSTLLISVGGGLASCGGRPQPAGEGDAANDAAPRSDDSGDEGPDDSPDEAEVERSDGNPDTDADAQNSTQRLGTACEAGEECATGYCTDGVCCSTASCPPCQTCGSSGACVPAPSGTACTAPHASAAACDGNGSCLETGCQPGYLDCDGDPNNGCETSFSLPNCGGCGVECRPDNVIAAVCSTSGDCGYSACRPGYLDCDGDKSNGCETPFSMSNCGSCGTACAPANVFGASCTPTSGGCTYATCAVADSAGHLYLDCDGNKANGCESDPSAEATCGACTNSCLSEFSCELRSPGGYSCRND